MSISCDCSMDYGDYPEFYREETPTARKAHICCECGSEIRPGEKYHKSTGKWDGYFATFRTCTICYRIGRHYCPNGYIFGELADAIYQCLGFDYRLEEK